MTGLFCCGTLGESRCRAGELSESCVSGKASCGDGELADRARRAVAGVMTRGAPAVSASDACGEGGARRPSTAAAAGDSIAAGIPLNYQGGEPAAGIDCWNRCYDQHKEFSSPSVCAAWDPKNARDAVEVFACLCQGAQTAHSKVNLAVRMLP